MEGHPDFIKEQRRILWRKNLIKNNIDEKRHLFYTFIKNTNTIQDTTLAVINADMPRTFPNESECKPHMNTIKSLLISYASFQKGDAYLQGFNYIMPITYMVFKDTIDGEADTWWCFSAIIGLIRPLMPDFNVTWFHWLRKYWMTELHNKLRVKRPTLNSILENESDTWSSLITVKWFMIWFAQTVHYKDLFKLWDFFISLPPEKLMLAYTDITINILYEVAPEITYQWTQRPTNILHTLLNIKVDGIDAIIAKKY